MDPYYGVYFSGDDKYGYAETVDQKSDTFELPETGLLDNWHPMSLRLVGGKIADYLGSNLSCRLCSDRLREILERAATKEDAIQWLPLIVANESRGLSYSILHFHNPPDVLCRKETIFAGDFVAKPVFLRHRIENHQVFAYPTAGKRKLFISKRVKLAIEAAKCTGMVFEKTAVR